MREPLELFKRAMIYALTILLCILAILLISGLVYTLVDSLMDPSEIVDMRGAILTYIGEILLAVIIIELIDTIVLYQKEHTVRLASVLMVALTAVSRELIVFDYYEGDVWMLIGTALAVMGLALAMYLVTKAAPLKEGERPS